ncbi:MAG TPA: SRPBCC domain-containing protein [Bdellovibrio sp.]|uniref:SRPBCC family protein n=1 Tax=Bdellovibrio sp. TaxID=28201 RepID=UPI002EE2993F
MGKAIEMSITVKATVGEVWNALTDADELENWWGEDVKLEPKVNGKFYEYWEDDAGNEQMASGKVLALKKMKHITFTWREKSWPKNATTECSFEITEEGKKSTLKLKHTGWETLPEDRREKVFKDFKVGWTFHMKELKEYLDM